MFEIITIFRLASGSGTRRSGLWLVSLMAERTSGYSTWYLSWRFILFIFIMQKQSVMWSFPFLQTIGIAIPFTFPLNPQIFHSFYSKRTERMAYPDPLVWLQINRDIPSLQNQWFLRDRKNHITADITTCPDYSYPCDPFLHLCTYSSMWIDIATTIYCIYFEN